MREKIGTWWNGTEPRERVLITLAFCLTVVIGLWFGIVSPLATAKAEAHRDLSQAIDDKALIDRGLLALQPTHQGLAGPASDNDAFRSAVTRTAQRRGLAISRLQSGAEGTLQLAFSDVSPTEIYAWLEEISTMPGGEVVGATITSRDEKVQAVIELQGTKS